MTLLDRMTQSEAETEFDLPRTPTHHCMSYLHALDAVDAVDALDALL